MPRRHDNIQGTNNDKICQYAEYSLFTSLCQYTGLCSIGTCSCIFSFTVLTVSKPVINIFMYILENLHVAVGMLHFKLLLIPFQVG